MKIYHTLAFQHPPFSLLGHTVGSQRARSSLIWLGYGNSPGLANHFLLSGPLSLKELKSGSLWFLMRDVELAALDMSCPGHSCQNMLLACFPRLMSPDIRALVGP